MQILFAIPLHEIQVEFSFFFFSKIQWDDWLEKEILV